jgi:hypothetical protein
MDCTLHDSLRIFRKWQDKKSDVYVKANIGPASFSLVGKVGQVQEDEVQIGSGLRPFTLRLSGAMFTFDDNLEWPESRRPSLPQGIPVSGLWVNLFLEKQLLGGCVFLELRSSD